MTDIEIAESIKYKKIDVIAKKLKLRKSSLINYGDYKCKIDKKVTKPSTNKLILVTAINPTSAGIGKTTVSIGLADGLSKLKQSVCLALREPSLGPVFGIKGGATGGGRSQVVPMIDINLHFTGDFHAITSANNLLSSLIDNHIYQGNQLDIDPKRIVFNRCLDLNDRALRLVTVSQTKIESPRDDSFTITAASEIMAIMCLAQGIDDLKKRLGNILVAYSKKGSPIFARDLKAQDSMAILLKEALKPNLVQTLEGTPALIHLGPFANIAHGCNSINATKLSMSLAKYTVTEAGFGADLGGEKFFDVKCRVGKLKPNAVVLVATIQALKLHGGAAKDNLKKEDLKALEKGMENLYKHIDIINNVYHLPMVVALNKYSGDTQAEVDYVINQVKDRNVAIEINDSWKNGGKGAIHLARKVMELCEEDNSRFSFAYNSNDTIENKILKVCTKVYGAKGVTFSQKAKKAIDTIRKLGKEKFPIVIAKTQYSLSDDPKLLGAPKNFNVKVRDIELKTGSEFIVVITNDIMLMPGLSKTPAATNMSISNQGKIAGIF